MLNFNDIFEVEISEIVIMQLQTKPVHIKEKLYKWVKRVESFGLYETRKIKGYHDESLQGNRFGQRSIRLNKAYCAIYILQKGSNAKFVKIQEVNKHDY